jgi:large subunit ribosomal protein L29
MKEINGMSAEDRKKKLRELRTELSRIRTMISSGGAVENPARSRELRKTIAQILTVENEQKLGIRTTEDKEKPKQAKTPSKAKESKTQ